MFVFQHHSYRSFQGFVCLMQISTRTEDFIVDTLKLRDELHVLNDVFTDPTIVKVSLNNQLLQSERVFQQTFYVQLIIKTSQKWNVFGMELVIFLWYKGQEKLIYLAFQKALQYVWNLMVAFTKGLHSEHKKTV